MFSGLMSRWTIPSSWAYCSARRGSSDRKSTRLNSSHLVISYADFCLKKERTDFPPFKHAILITVRSAHEFRAKLSSETLKRRLSEALPEEFIYRDATPAPILQLQCYF